MWIFSSCGGILELRQGFQASSCVGPEKPNLPFELRGKAGGCTRVNAGPKRPHLGFCPGPKVPLQGPKLMSIESVMPSYHLILCCPLLLLPSIFPSSGACPQHGARRGGRMLVRPGGFALGGEGLSQAHTPCAAFLPPSPLSGPPTPSLSARGSRPSGRTSG